MFISKRRSIVVPQLEHARLAGVLASLWGNDAFEFPEISRDSFLAGVTLHDRGYDPFDTMPVDTSDEQEWIDVQQRGRALRFNDPVAEAIVLLHLRRLASYRPSNARVELTAQLEEDLDELAHSARLDKRSLLAADLITKLCDDIAFDFCWEREVSRETSVYARRDAAETVKIRYDVHPTETGGLVQLKPWPFSVRSYQGFLIGYRQETYPQQTDPIAIHFEIAPG
ncbi:MAG: DUF3891 family protein [Deltaproteobacteria bacterium]|nr:DUF3891 family protein [Deltaproteobacteria bacterium]